MTKISQLKFSSSGMKCRGSKEATGDEKKKMRGRNFPRFLQCVKLKKIK